MKRNKIIRLLVFGISLLSVGFVKAAELMQQDVQAEMQRGYVPSLQTLALNYIGKKKCEGNEQLFGKFKELLEQKNMLFGACKKDITREVAKIAALEYPKSPFNRVSPPLNQYKKANPVLGLLIDQGRIEYSLSIKDLMDAGAIIVIENEFGAQNLYLSNLSLTSFDGLQELANLSSLQRLYLRNNQLKELTPETLANLPSLQYLDFSSNQLKELTPEALANLPSLQELDLSNNQLKELTPGALANLPSLQLLNLSNNQLKELIPETLANLPSLQLLNLSNNQLKELIPETLANLPSLQLLNLSSNQLKELIPETLANLPSLQWLYLSDNQLKELTPGTLANLSSLQWLYLSDNQLKELTPGTLANLPELQVLKLENNQLTELTPGTLANLPELRELDLSNNQLTELTPGTLANLPELQVLKLENNQLTEEAQRVLRGLRIYYLDLNNQRVPHIEEIVEEQDEDLQEEPVRVSRLQRATERVMQFNQDHPLIIAAGVGTLAIGAVIVVRSPVRARQLARQAVTRAHDACVIS